jgi:hypothetical protein
MAEYKGSQGIAALKKKLELQANMLGQLAAMSVARHIVDESPVGVDIYPSAVGGVENDPGDFKNSWKVGVGAVDYDIREADASGLGAYAEAPTDAARFDHRRQDEIYVTNSVDHAGQVENGWYASDDPDRIALGWEDRDGYHVVQNNKDKMVGILKDVANFIASGGTTAR